MQTLGKLGAGSVFWGVMRESAEVVRLADDATGDGGGGDKTKGDPHSTGPDTKAL